MHCLGSGQQKKLQTLIVVPTTSLVEQMYKDFEDYGWNAKGHCHKEYIHGVLILGLTKDVIITTWQSVYKLPKTYFERFGAIIGDEAHLFKAKSLTSIMNKLHDCKYRIGFTGTLDGTQTNRLVLEGVFGTVNKITKTEKLIRTRTSLSLRSKYYYSSMTNRPLTPIRRRWTTLLTIKDVISSYVT